MEYSNDGLLHLVQGEASCHLCNIHNVEGSDIFRLDRVSLTITESNFTNLTSASAPLTMENPDTDVSGMRENSLKISNSSF